MTEYNYRNATYTNLAKEGIAKESVFEMLFEGTSASGEPATAHEISLIESVSEEVSTIEVQDVTVRESAERNDFVLFDVRTPSVNVTVPLGSRDDDTRVCHEEDIPYDYYDIAVLN